MRSGVVIIVLADMHLQLAACSGNSCLQLLPMLQPLGEEIAIRDGAGACWQLWEQAGSTRTCSGPEAPGAVQCPVC